MLLKRLTYLALAALLTLVACDDKDESTHSDAGAVDDAGQTVKQAQKKAPEANEEAQDDGELQRAKASSPGGATVNEKPPLNISKLLTKKDVKSLTRGSIVSEPLVGKAPSPDYNAVHLHPGGRDFYGAGLQVWKAKDKQAATERIQQMRSQYLAAKDAPKAAPVKGKQAFVSERAGIKNYVFVVGSKKESHVLAVSCGEQFCTGGWGKIFDLARRASKRLE